jgi:hypothetical protein
VFVPGLLAKVFVGKALEFAFAKEGRWKIAELRPGAVGESVTANNPSVGNSEPKDHPTLNRRFLPPWLYDALEISINIRGQGWDFGQGVHIPSDPRPQQRSLFLRATAISFLAHFLILDIAEFTLKLFPGAGSPEGGSMFYPHLPPLQRYTISTIIHTLTGCAILCGFVMIYDMFTLIGVGLFGSAPAEWPPALDHPFCSDSLHIFWSKRWHQFLRRTFMIYGGYPGKWLFGDYGMVQGIFLASGLYHECGMYAMGQGWDNLSIIFFAIQAPLLFCEKLWRKITGQRVGGPLGMLWVYLDLFILAQPMGKSKFPFSLHP